MGNFIKKIVYRDQNTETTKKKYIFHDESIDGTITNKIELDEIDLKKNEK